MSSIYFYRRQYDDDVINCWFSIYDGPNPYQADGWNVGDDVSLIWDVSEEIYKAMGNMERRDFMCYKTGLNDNKYSVHIPLTIVKKRHTVAQPTSDKFGMLSYFGSNIFVKAKDGLWEDVLLWVLLGRIPEWAKDL